jgi:type IV pilus assembly protein PilA
MHSLRQRINTKDESGFTLIELLVVLIIIGILLAIAVPSYLHFKDQANQKAAASDVRQAMPAAESFYQDNNTYTGMDKPALTNIDAGIAVDTVKVLNAGAGYCIDKTVGGFAYHVNGPGGTPTTGACA